MADSPTPVDELRAWTGHQLDDRSGNAVGKIEGLLVDEPGGAAEWLAMRSGRFGQRSLVPARDAVAAVDRVWVPFEAELIRLAPKPPASGLTQADELAALAHYGLGGPAGRAAEISDREPGEITAIAAR